MMQSTGHDQCVQARANLDRLRQERSRHYRELTLLRENVARRKGEIDEANNTLSQIERRIRAVGDGVVAVGVGISARDYPGAARDGAALAIRLAQDEALQRERREVLRRQLADAEWKLGHAEDKLEIIESEIEKAENFMTSNGCW